MPIAYVDLYALRTNSSLETLRKKVAVALMHKANAISKLEINTPAQRAWALSILSSPTADTERAINYLLAEYSSATESAITGAADSVVQTAVNSMVDALLGVD